MSVKVVERRKQMENKVAEIKNLCSVSQLRILLKQKNRNVNNCMTTTVLTLSASQRHLSMQHFRCNPDLALSDYHLFIFSEKILPSDDEVQARRQKMDKANCGSFFETGINSSFLGARRASFGKTTMSFRINQYKE